MSYRVDYRINEDAELLSFDYILVEARYIEKKPFLIISLSKNSG